MTTKDPIIIDNVPYYACATTAQAAALGKKGTGTTQLCTADDVLKGTYGVTFVENTKVSYAQNQTVAYVDLEKDTLPENIEGEVNLELASVSCGVAMAEEQWEKQTVTKTENATGSETTSWSGWKGGGSWLVPIYTNAINAGRTIQYDEISSTWAGQDYSVSGFLTTTKSVWYATQGSDGTWGSYTSLSKNITTSSPTKIKVEVTFTPQKDFWQTGGEMYGSVLINVNIKVPYTYQTQELVQLDNQYIPCKPISGSSALEPYSQSVYTDVIRPSKISKTANVVDLILQGPTRADYTYRSGTDLDNKQLGLIIPIQFKFNDVSTINLAGFGVNSILSEKWNSSAAYAAYGGYNVSSWFKQNSDIIGSGCSGGSWQTSDRLYWKCYKMPDYSDDRTRIYRIDKLFSNFSSVQNGLVIELKWNPKDHILPEGSVQSRTQLCQLMCELDISINNRGVYRTTVIINIWLEPFNAIVSPEPPVIEEDRLYVLVKKPKTGNIFPTISTSDQNKYYVTFGRDYSEVKWKYHKRGDDGLSEWYSTADIKQTEAWDGTDNTALGGFGINYEDEWGQDTYVCGDKGLQSLFTDNNDLLEVILPNKVVGIGHLCFTGCQNLKKITFGSKLSNIQGDCFKNCTSLQQLDFTPCTATWFTIGLRCFQNCTSMSKIRLPKNAAFKIGQQAFENNSNMELEIQDGSWNSECGFNQIGYCGFKNCNKLCQTLDLGLCHTVGRYAFENCGSIKNIKVKWAPRPDLINGPVICHGAFKGCTNVENFYSKNDPAVVHCCNIWYKNAINPQTAKLHVEASRKSQYAHWAQFGDFETHGNLIGDLG